MKKILPGKKPLKELSNRKKQSIELAPCKETLLIGEKKELLKKLATPKEQKLLGEIKNIPKKLPPQSIQKKLLGLLKKK